MAFSSLLSKAVARPLRPGVWAVSTRPHALAISRRSTAGVASISLSQQSPRWASTGSGSTDGSKSAKDEKLFSLRWDPVWTYLVLLLFIGSQTINVMSEKNKYKETKRRLNARIEMLNETVKRIQDGEDVDIKKELGTGLSADEKAWADLLAEIESQDLKWQQALGLETPEAEPAVESATETK
ncbi:uncharacterized protein V1510DRAFT_392666 [Dipodascopsis tothii]|uniref:uncharacterized protein n=1 Tax=Dipodascopsis tothii TaxID=44089 RepID=UPI0034CD88A5